MLGGGNNSFAGVNFENIAFGFDRNSPNTDLPLTVANANGIYTIQAGANATRFIIEAQPSSQANKPAADQVTLYGFVTPNNLNITTDNPEPPAAPEP